MGYGPDTHYKPYFPCRLVSTHTTPTQAKMPLFSAMQCHRRQVRTNLPLVDTQRQRRLDDVRQHLHLQTRQQMLLPPTPRRRRRQSAAKQRDGEGGKAGAKRFLTNIP